MGENVKAVQGGFHERFKLFISAYDELNPFEMNFFMKLLFQSYVDVAVSRGLNQLKRKDLEDMLSSAILKARQEIARQEHERLGRVLDDLSDN
jgi:hypothetical protein